MFMHYIRGILIIVLLMAFMPLALAEEEIAPEDRIENWKGKTVLTFTPHPDDDTFACGGIMSILAKNGNKKHPLDIISCFEDKIVEKAFKDDPFD